MLELNQGKTVFPTDVTLRQEKIIMHDARRRKGKVYIMKKNNAQNTQNTQNTRRAELAAYKLSYGARLTIDAVAVVADMINVDGMTSKDAAAAVFAQVTARKYENVSESHVNDVARVASIWSPDVAALKSFSAMKAAAAAFNRDAAATRALISGKAFKSKAGNDQAAALRECGGKDARTGSKKPSSNEVKAAELVNDIRAAAENVTGVKNAVHVAAILKMVDELAALAGVKFEA